MGCWSHHAGPKWIIELKRPPWPARNVAGMGATPQVLAGMVSTAVVAASFGNIALANVGNAGVLDLRLPSAAGPIWFLHTFYPVSSAQTSYRYVHCRPVRRGRPLAVTTAVPMAAVAWGSQW